MPLKGLTAAKELHYTRAKRLLWELDLYDDLRAAVLVGLTDDGEPNRFAALRNRGLPLSYAAGTRQLFEYAGPMLGAENRIDRERRDYVFPQLREVGILRIATVLPAKEAAASGELLKLDVHDPPKTPNSAYLLTDEARTLFDAADVDFPQLLADFVVGAPQRRVRYQQHLATQAIQVASSNKHAVLMRAAAQTLVNSEAGAKGFEVVCIDDSDGQRLSPQYAKELARLNLTPDLGSRWPDVILANENSRQVWFVDAVTTDGEVDTVRKEELEKWSADRGWTVAGYTTAYERWSDAARRQGATKNLAVGSTMWIAEDGGKLFEVRALPADEPTGA
jgi:hypothetical protein